MTQFIFVGTHLVMLICILGLLYASVFQRTAESASIYETALPKRHKQHRVINQKYDERFPCSRCRLQAAALKNLILKLDSLFLKELPNVEN